MSELPKTYDPKSVEDKLYKFWVDSGFSTPRSIRTRNRHHRIRSDVTASCTWAMHSMKRFRTS